VVYVNNDKTIIKNLFTGKPLVKSYVKGKLNFEDMEKDEKICVFNGDKFIGIYRTINEGDIIAKPEFVYN
jgi:hypothetical protein